MSEGDHDDAIPDTVRSGDAVLEALCASWGLLLADLPGGETAVYIMPGRRLVSGSAAECLHYLREQRVPYSLTDGGEDDE